MSELWISDLENIIADIKVGERAYSIRGDRLGLSGEVRVSSLECEAIRYGFLVADRRGVPRGDVLVKLRRANVSLLQEGV